jgi:hypothetical protein
VSCTTDWTLDRHSLSRRESLIGGVMQEVPETLTAKGMITRELDRSARRVEADRTNRFIIVSTCPLVFLLLLL